MEFTFMFSGPTRVCDQDIVADNVQRIFIGAPNDNVSAQTNSETKKRTRYIYYMNICGKFAITFIYTRMSAVRS